MRLSFRLFIITSLYLGAAQAQTNDWFSTGTSWTYHYTVNQVFQTVDAITTFAITEQAVVNSQPCSKMEVADGGTNPFLCAPIPPPFYLYESNDSVFYASDYDNTFRLAYDFGAEVGDSWIYTIPNEVFSSIDTIVVTVQSTSTTVLDGQELKVLDLLYANISTLITTTLVNIDTSYIQVTQRLGTPDLFFIPFGEAGGEIFACEGPFNVSLQCYSAEDLSYQNPLFQSCTLGTSDVDNNSSIHIHPNPLTKGEILTLDTKITSAGEFEVWDLNGKLVHKSKVNAGLVNLALDLERGIYVVHLIDQTSRFTQKLVVQ